MFAQLDHTKLAFKRPVGQDSNLAWRGCNHKFFSHCISVSYPNEVIKHLRAQTVLSWSVRLPFKLAGNIFRVNWRGWGAYISTGTEHTSVWRHVAWCLELFCVTKIRAQKEALKDCVALGKWLSLPVRVGSQILPTFQCSGLNEIISNTSSHRGSW